MVCCQNRIVVPAHIGREACFVGWQAQDSAAPVRGLLQFLPVIGQQATESPVFLVNLLNDNMRMFRFFAKHTHQRIRDFLDQLRFLLAACTFGDLQVYLGHVVGIRGAGKEMAGVVARVRVN
jgi:hypothetical protein